LREELPLAKWPPPVQRKRRTREHVIADLSIHHLEGFVLRCGWTVERVQHDYGYDLQMWTYSDEGLVENGWVLFQVKATDDLPGRTGRGGLALRLQWRDVMFWLNEDYPVLLVLYDAPRDRAYWLHVQAFYRQRRRLAGRRGTTTTVRVPLTNVLDEQAIRHFARLRDDARA
jgi:hypothetical protein